MADKSFSDPDKLIKQVLKDLRDSTALTLARTGEEGKSILSLLFKSEGRYLGVSWEPLNPKYHAYKIKKGYSEKILHRTTTLRRSFTYKLGPGYVEIGTNVKDDRTGEPYPVFLEYGTAKMPARPFMAPTYYALIVRLPDIARRVFEDVFGR